MATLRQPTSPPVRAYTPDSFFEHDPPKKRPALIPASMSSWLKRDENANSNKQPGYYTTNSTNAGFLRISEPMPAIPNPDLSRSLAGRTKSNSPSRILGMGAEVVRTPMEALDGLSSVEQPPTSTSTTSQTVYKRHAHSSSKQSIESLPTNSELPPIPERTTSLSRSPRTSRSSPHLKQRSNSSSIPDVPSSPPTSPPRSASKAPNTTPEKVAELPPLPSFRPISAFVRSSSVTSPPPSATSIVALPPPPFLPVLISPCTSPSVPPEQQLIALETASCTLTTTLATLTATPSHLSSYLTTLVPRAPSPPPSPGSPFTAAFKAHQEALGLLAANAAATAKTSTPSSPTSSKDSASVYPDEDTESPVDTIEDDSHSISKTPTPTAPLKTPTRRMHIFLDRPSSPYTHILAYLRSLSSATVYAQPGLPRSITHMPASSAVRMDALLEVREEAVFLGMDALIRICDDEIARRRTERAKKLSLRVQKGTKGDDRGSISSGHETAVEESGASRPSSGVELDVFGSVTNVNISTVGAQRTTPAPIANAIRSTSPARASILRTSNPAAPPPPPTRPTLHSHSSSAPSHPYPHPHSQGHSRFPRSIDSTLDVTSSFSTEDAESEIGVLPDIIPTKRIPQLATRQRSRSVTRTAGTECSSTVCSRI